MSENLVKKTLVEHYGLSKASQKWLPKGAELLQYIGMEVVYTRYTQTADGGWDHAMGVAVIQSISDYDVNTINYQVILELEDGTTVIDRITPDGFKSAGPDEGGVEGMFRIVPMSLHYKLMEMENFFERLGNIYEERDSLDIDALKMFAGLPENSPLLEYCCNVGAAVKTSEGDLMWIRISKFTISNIDGIDWAITFLDEEGVPFTIAIQEGQTEFKFETPELELSEEEAAELGLNTDREIGILKFLDLRD